MLAQLITRNVERALDWPIVDPKTTLPAPAVRVRFWLPLIVLPKLMAPVPVVMEVAPVKETALVNVAAAPVVASVPCKATEPPPL